MKKILFACLLLAATASLGAQNPQPIEENRLITPNALLPKQSLKVKPTKCGKHSR